MLKLLGCDPLSMYSRSSGTQRSKPMALRPETCHKHVMPGRIDSLRSSSTLECLTFSDFYWDCRLRPDEARVAHKYVAWLWEFVDRIAPEEAPPFGVRLHGAELVHHEVTAV